MSVFTMLVKVYVLLKKCIRNQVYTARAFTKESTFDFEVLET